MIKSFAEINDKYIIRMDESWKYERNKKPEDKIWYELVMLPSGFIFLFTENSCQAYFDSQEVAKKYSILLTRKKIKHTCILLDFEGIITFDLIYCDKIAKFLKVRTKLSDDKKAKLIDIGKQYQFEKNIARKLRTRKE